MNQIKNTILQGDVIEKLKEIPDEYVDCIITSPPYFGLRDYSVDGQIGLEKSLEEYLNKMLGVTSELKRVLKKEGTMFWNHGDSYGTGSGSGIRSGKQATNRGTQTNDNWQKNGKQKVVGYEKCLLLQAHRLALRMIDEQQWILRNVIIWHKPNAMPSSVIDRFTVDYEPVLFLTKTRSYYFEQQFEPHIWADRDKRSERHWKNNDAKSGKMTQQRYSMKRVSYGKQGKNKRCVWKIPTKGVKEAHFATFPEALIEPMIKAGCPEGGLILDPFMGAGTTALVAKKLNRNYLGIELNPEYIKIAEKRIREVPDKLI